MQKYVVIQKCSTTKYVVVEAENAEDAMCHIPTSGDSFSISGEYFKNIEAHKVREGTSIMATDVSCRPFIGNYIVNQNEKKGFIARWKYRLGWKPSLTLIDFSKIKLSSIYKIRENSN